MATLKFLILSFLISNCAFAQLDSTILFEQSKGTWDYPFEKVTKVVCFESSKSACATANALRSMSATFIADSSYPVIAVYDGQILTIQEIEGSFVIITKYGDYFITYFGLTKPKLKKGDFVEKGQFLATLQENFDDKFSVEIYLSDRRKSLDPFPWFVCKSCP